MTNQREDRTGNLPPVTQENRERAEAYRYIEDWLSVCGDLDDFIFYDQQS